MFKTPKEFLAVLEKAEDSARAGGHVGALYDPFVVWSLVEYAEREREAQNWVSKAFLKVRTLIRMRC